MKKHILTVKEPIAIKFGELVDEIAKYESDTFSASQSKLKRSEAFRIAEKMVLEDIQARIDTDTMDGCMISEELENIRD